MPESLPLLLPNYEDALENELLIKSTHLIYFRLAFALISLMCAAAVGIITGAQINTSGGVLYVAAAVIAYSLLALAVVKLGSGNNRFLLRAVNAALLGSDIVALSALVHVSRGIESDLYFLYLLPIVLASHTFGRRGIYATAFGASVAYVCTLLVENSSFLPYVIGDDTRETLAAAYSQRLLAKILTRSAMLVGVSFIWALFCEHMSNVAQRGATNLRAQLVANNTLVAESKAQAAREQLLNIISSAIRSTLDIHEILSTTVSQLSAALGVTRCAIITMPENANDAPGHWEALNTDNPEYGATFSDSFCDFALVHLSQYIEHADETWTKTFVYRSPIDEPLFAQIKPELERLHIRSLIAQPMMYGPDSKGVILIAECDSDRDWNSSEMELTKAVGGQVAIAIEHARLVDQLSRKNRDLLNKNLNLDAKNLELRTVQSQMIHQEKMASLGRMVAGIAHELNNPVNFVHGNVPYLREYFDDLKQVIDGIESCSEETKAQIEALKKQVKYEFLVQDLDNIIADLGEGSERIRQIIKNLRSFSRLDEAELKEASIQEGIESTIKILNQYYGRDKIQPVIEFSDIPPVTCYPGKLNQVWMNLLSNAAQAVSEVANPCVRIKTELDEEWVVVSVSDNGTGIKATDQSKIFEPFYTTKPVGQGTGLGLSICHSIIERHGGRIWFETKLGEGTTFKVRIPLKATPELREVSRIA